MGPKTFYKPLIYLNRTGGRVTKWLCGGLQIRIRGFKSLPALQIQHEGECQQAPKWLFLRHKCYLSDGCDIYIIMLRTKAEIFLKKWSLNYISSSYSLILPLEVCMKILFPPSPKVPSLCFSSSVVKFNVIPLIII